MPIYSPSPMQCSRKGASPLLILFELRKQKKISKIFQIGLFFPEKWSLIWQRIFRNCFVIISEFEKSENFINLLLIRVYLNSFNLCLIHRQTFYMKFFQQNLIHIKLYQIYYRSEYVWGGGSFNRVFINMYIEFV